MNYREFQDKIKKLPTVTEKYLHIVEGNFFLDIQDGHFVNRPDKHMLNFINISNNGFIIITPFAHGIYTDKFLNEIAKTSIELFKLDYWGNPIWGFYPASRTLANLTKAQILLTTEKHNEKRASFTLELIKEKLKTEGQKIGRIPILKKNYNSWLNDMMILEGEAAGKYWEQYKKDNALLDSFTRANEKQKNKKNYKASDYINVLLNLGYGILAHKITFALYEEGLNPTIGFYHVIKAKGQRYSLTWDLIEPLRTIIDEIVSKNIDIIDIDDFEFNVEDKVRFLMLKTEPHKIGTYSGKLLETPYKKWIDIFVKEINSQDLTLWIQKYKALLFEVMTDENFSKEESERASGIKNAQHIIKRLSEKHTTKLSPIIDEKIKGSLEEEPQEPEQDKDIAGLK